MARQDGRTLAFEVEDAKSLLKATKKHFTAMKKKGATEEEVKTFEGTIAEAAKLVRAQGGGERALEAVRQELKDVLGDYRTAGDLAANGFSGSNGKLAKALRVSTRFTPTDLKLKTYVTGLPAIAKRHSASLAPRGFGPVEQVELGNLATEFVELLGRRGENRGARTAERVARISVFERLRDQASYFRRVGRKVFRSDSRRAEFDRVKQAPKAKAKAAPVAKAAKTAKAAKAPPVVDAGGEGDAG